MDSDRWRQISGLYHAALERAGDDRRLFLDEACKGDQTLRNEVESLLEHETSAEVFLARPAEVVEEVLPEGWRAATDALQPGINLGRYQIERQLGQGGMGRVFLANDPLLRRKVAIKVLESPADDKTLRDRLLREARSVATLNHQNICAIYEVGEGGGPAFIAMEYVDGRPLSDLIAGGALSIEDALRYGIETADALAHAHDRGIVHRDLKAANAIVSSTGVLKLVDFGLARRTDVPMSNATTAATLARPGVTVGTPYAMAPEQVRGGTTDARTDVWALGVLLYEMLAGAKPFDAPTIGDMFSSILRDPPTPLPPSTPDALRSVVHKCLAKDPVQRYQRASDVRLVLETIASTLRVSTERGVPQTASRTLVQRFRSIGWIAGAGSVAAVLGLSLLVPGIVRRVDRPSDQAPGRGDGSGVRSLAVLPLQNLSTDSDQEFFSDGMTEALIADLARVSGLRVISRTSAMTYKSALKPLPQIARELNVDVVVEGSVMRSGDRVRITAQLIDAKTDRHLWGNSYERDLRDVLSLQGEVARAIAQEIQITLTPQEEARLAAARPVNPVAHEAYLRGRYRLLKFTEQTVKQAIDDFKQACEIDPGSALAYAGLSDAYAALRYAAHSRPHDVMPQAKTAAAKALQLDPTLAEGHVSMAIVLMSYEFDWRGTERELKQAIDLSPNLADAHHYYALYLAGLGRHGEARSEIERAMQLDPLSLVILNDAGWVYYLAHQYDRTIEVNRKVIDLDPSFWPAYRDLGLGYERVGRYPDAVAALQKARQLDTNSSVLEMLGGAYAAWGKKDEARKVLRELDELARQHYVCPYEVATIHAGLGDKESTIEWLERGYKERADCMAWTGSDPKLDELRGDARFEDLMRRIGIPR